MKPNLLLLLVILFISSCVRTKIYQWRGDNRSGVYSEKNLLKTWQEGGPQLIWETEGIGNGYVSPTVTDDALYITGEIDSMANLFKFDRNGKLIWKVIYDREWTKSFQGARSHATVVNGLVYVGSGMGNLFCISAKTGEIIWSKKIADDFQGESPLHGHSEAPVIEGDKIFWTAGGSIHNVVAMDRFSGELIWSNKGFQERSAYNSPLVIYLPKRKILVTFSAYHLMGLDAETGTLLWSHEQARIAPEKREPGYGDTHANTVLFENGAIYYAEGDGNGGVKLQLSEDGTQITPVWNNKDFDSYMGGIVKLDEKLYGCGSAKPSLLCVDAMTGEITDSLKTTSGSVIVADGMLYYYNFRGQVQLVDISGDRMDVASVFRIEKGTKEHFSHPVIYDGVLYIRRGNALMAFDIKNRKT
ncbi:MAG: PQQ-like beta-propeller repeat protein [Prolixibacteraceae bacterium]|jgi:outer membrane protein assembly factor BamB|nr:PQQ-like beta-propeller repeat protein [Prolixibacteraceae bacterium]